MTNIANSRLLMHNRILSVLPAAEIDYLKPHLEPIKLLPREIIFQSGDVIRHVYFPRNGMISLLAVTEEGQTIEVAFIGFEGLVGFPLFFGRSEAPYQVMVQVPAECWRVEAADALALFRRGGVFHDVALRFAYVLLRQIAQSCVCNHFHTIEARLCRWLAVMTERSKDSRLFLTQEFLAQMLGVQRTSIGMIAHSMQAAGIIRYRRGRIEIIDNRKLKEIACECLQLINNEHKEFCRDKNFPVMSDSRQTW